MIILPKKFITRYLKKTPAICSSLGFYGKGKTYIHGKITKTKLPDGITLHTRGISMKEVEIDAYPLWVLDIAGFQTPISHTFNGPESISLKKVDEDFISNIILNITDIFVFVVQHLTLQEQDLLEKLKEIISNKKMNKIVVEFM